jgi:hypothetical protein
MSVRRAVLERGRQEPATVRGASFEPVETRQLSDRQPRPSGPEIVARSRRPRRLKELSPPAEAAHGDDRDPRGNQDPVVFHAYGSSDTVTKSLTNAADMSGSDSEPDVIMMSGNWYCDVSTDGGGSWKRLDPTTIFPNTFAGGFCCDQVVLHVRAIDTFVWFLQYDADGAGQGAFRIAVASTQSVKDDPTAWTYWDFVGGDFGFPTSDMDYPDLACSDSFLFVSTDVFAANGRLVVRIPLKELQAGGSLNFDFTDPTRSTNAWGGHLVQQCRSRAVWVGHRSNSQIEVYSLPDAGNTYSSFTVDVAAWPNGTHSSLGPDGNDWLTKLDSFPKFAVTGGVERDDGHVMLAWSATAGRGSASAFEFPNTHVRLVEVDTTARSAVSELQVWNDKYAFAYPVLAVNARDEVGIMLGWGGSGDHANCAMGILGDFVVWFRDGSTRTVQRFGDYLSTRPGERNRSLFGAWGYWVTDVAGDPASCDYHPFYARYGRASA